MIPADQVEPIIRRISLAQIEGMRPTLRSVIDEAIDNAIAEASLPGLIWDRALVLKDIIIQTLHDPRRDFDRQYRYLRRYFISDTGTTDLVPDFVDDCEELSDVWRYLDRMGCPTDEQIKHVENAFDELIGYMDLVFRPAQVGYRREPWPGKPISTPNVANSPPALEVNAVESSAWTGLADAVMVARRVLSIAPLAVTALEALIEASEKARNSNSPPDLQPAELTALRDLHRELGELIAIARKGGNLNENLQRVRSLFQRSFQVLKGTGELVIADVPPLAATMVPSWATFGICSSLLGIGEASSTAFAVGTMAVSGSLQAARHSNGSKNQV